MPTRVWVVTGPEWKAAAAKLRVVDNELPDWVEEELEDALDPVVRRAKSKVMRAGVRGGPGTGHTGLRARVASGVGVRKGISTKSTAYFRIYTSMADVSESPIPRGLDEVKGWRHPLFGNKNHWYQSVPTKPGWFTDTIADSDDDIERAIGNALDHAERMF
jgi:hypothetical protein